MSNSNNTDTELEPGIVEPDTKREGLPPGSDTRGDDDIPGTAGRGEPFEDAPAADRLDDGSSDAERADGGRGDGNAEDGNGVER